MDAMVFWIELSETMTESELEEAFYGELGYGYPGGMERQPHYSTDLNHAIKLMGKKWLVEATGVLDAGREMFVVWDGESANGRGRGKGLAQAFAPALAITRAFLIEKMKEEGK